MKPEKTVEEYEDKIFDLTEDNNQLRKRITYLQEEVASLEDDVRKLKDQLDRASNIEI